MAKLNEFRLLTRLSRINKIQQVGGAISKNVIYDKFSKFSCAKHGLSGLHFHSNNRFFMKRIFKIKQFTRLKHDVRPISLTGYVIDLYDKKKHAIFEVTNLQNPKTYILQYAHLTHFVKIPMEIFCL